MYIQIPCLKLCFCRIPLVYILNKFQKNYFIRIKKSYFIEKKTQDICSSVRKAADIPLFLYPFYFFSFYSKYKIFVTIITESALKNRKQNRIPETNLNFKSLYNNLGYIRTAGVYFIALH